MATTLGVMIVSPSLETREGLRTAFMTAPGVSAVQVADGTQEADQILDRATTDLAAVVVDLFGFRDAASVAEWIFGARESKPHLVFGLFGSDDTLERMPGITGHAAERLSHYYRLSSAVPISAVPYAVDRLILQFHNYLASYGTRRGLEQVKVTLQAADQGHDLEHLRNRIEELIQDSEASMSKGPQVLPGRGSGPLAFIEAAEFQRLVVASINEAKRGLSQSKWAHLAVMSVGLAIVIASFVAVLLGASWEVASFGGLGVVGLVGAFISNPLNKVSEHAGRMVELQMAYDTHLTMIEVVTLHAVKGEPLELLSRVGEETRKTIAAIKESPED